jgi:ATP-dependent Clp protease ATP-binding subunit ClpB
MVRIDMSEYMESHAVARMIGSPPGYVGHDEGGQLTEAVRRKPYCVMLLDEIEKAHQDVLNVLLQVLDDGRLTDGKGRVVSFRNAVIIMTSNIGSHLFFGDKSQVTSDKPKTYAAVMEAVRRQLRPEFLNRIDDVILFNRLAPEHLSHIVDLQVARAQARLSERRVTLKLTKQAKEFLASVGYDPAFGARPLKRAVQRFLIDPLALRLLDGSIKPGQTVEVDLPARPERAQAGTNGANSLVFSGKS